MNFIPLKSILLGALCVASAFPEIARAQQNTAADAAQGEEDRTGIPESYKGPASAVAAIVNNSVITTYDIQQRMRLMMLSSAGQVTADMLPQLQARALSDLKDEKLQLLEVQEFEKRAERRLVETKEIEAEMQSIAAQGGVTLEQLEVELGRDGISLNTLRQQVLTNIAWPRLVSSQFSSRVRVSEDEIEATLERMREDAGQEQTLLSEICIPVEDPAEAQAYFQAGLQLIEQMRRGVPFSVVAQQFSACTSAAAGGDMGWVRAGELAPELDQAIRELPTGAVTNPIPSEGALMILAVRDKRQPVTPGQPSFTLAYAGAPLSMGRSAARLALEKLPAANACAAGAKRVDLGKGIGIAYLENITLDQIDSRFHGIVEDLDRREMSAVIEVDDALHTVYVCEKDEGLGLPSRDSIEDRIYGRQLTRMAQQYLRDVERKAMVDIRVKPPTQPNG